VLSSLLDRVDRLAGLNARASAHWQVGNYQQDRHTNIAIVGCGFVADFYMRTLRRYPELELVGVVDRDYSRATSLASLHRVEAYPSLDALLEDRRIEVVVNLTNPRSHFAVSKACLEAGKHVYSEKPLAMILAEAEELVCLAEARGLILSSAPCSILGESARALRNALLSEEIGQVRIVYAELDDGPIHQMHPEEWASPSGIPWPWQDEFSVGCTMEHAGYHLTWLVALFGPVRSVTAFSSCLIPEKLPSGASAPDFSVGCLHFHSGVVARLTCSIVAPHDHSLRIIGDKGVLSVDECWHNCSPVLLRRFSPLSFRAETYPWLSGHGLTRSLYRLDGKSYASAPKGSWRRRLRRHDMDYVLGVAELAAAARERRPCRLPASFALHVNEIALAIQNARETGSSTPIRSTFSPVEQFWESDPRG
jgi:predicted dehydrogenase